MKSGCTLLFAFLAISLLGHAQTDRCATQSFHELLMLDDPAYRKQISDMEKQIEALIHNQQSKRTQAEIYTIPVAVHVIHLGEATGTGTNITDAQIHSAIAGLNSRWRNTTGSGIDMEIEFCLSTTDPNGNPTTGITRVNGSTVPDYSTYGISIGNCEAGADEEDVKILSRWPVANYYNIWVVNRICDGQWGGWTYYPNGGPNDGVVIQATDMRSDDPLLTHEVGHGFFAYHTFEGEISSSACPTENTCTTQGDRVCDTPPHNQSDCASTSTCFSTAAWENTRYNYMSYCSGTNRFTQGQKDRIRAVAAVSPRASLLISSKCAPITGISDQEEGQSLTVVPNPSNGSFQVKTESTGPMNVVIYNSQGETILHFTKILESEIDLTTHSKGLYYLVIQTGGKNYHKKLVIQ